MKKPTHDRWKYQCGHCKAKYEKPHPYCLVCRREGAVKLADSNQESTAPLTSEEG